MKVCKIIKYNKEYAAKTQEVCYNKKNKYSKFFLIVGRAFVVRVCWGKL